MANQIKLCSSKQKVKNFTNLRWIGCKDEQERGNWAIKCCEGKPQEVKAQKGSDAHLGHWIITRALGLLSQNTNWQYELCTSSHEKRSKFNFSDYPRMELIWEFNYSAFLGSFCFISHTRCLSIHFPECMESNSSFKNKSINYIRKFLCLVLCVFILKEHIWFGVGVVMKEASWAVTRNKTMNATFWVRKSMTISEYVCTAQESGPSFPKAS